MDHNQKFEQYLAGINEEVTIRDYPQDNYVSKVWFTTRHKEISAYSRRIL